MKPIAQYHAALKNIERLEIQVLEITLFLSQKMKDSRGDNRTLVNSSKMYISARYTVVGFTSATKFRNEIQIYPFESFLCDLGGSLGLFVGFSFLTLWDFFDIVYVKIKQLSQYYK